MPKSKLVVIIILALLEATLGVFLLTRDSGPPVVVQGNFSAEDVAEIKSAVKLQLWREAFPNLSRRTIQRLPWAARRAVSTPVISIESVVEGLNVGVGEKSSPFRTTWTSNRVTQSYFMVNRAAFACLSTNYRDSGFFLTEGPGGWSVDITSGWRR